MKTRIALILAIVLGWGCMAHADWVMSFDDVFKTPRIVLDERQIYISDKHLKKSYIYSRSNSKLVKVIGGHGGGPGELQHLGHVTLFEENIHVCNYPRLSIFTKTGKLKKTIKGPTDAFQLLPFGDEYVGKKNPPPLPKNKNYPPTPTTIHRRHRETGHHRPNPQPSNP